MLDGVDIQKIADEIFGKMVTAIQTHYPTNFLAVLFKNPSMSRRVYELGIK